MSFSTKYGFKKVRDEFQVDSMDVALHNSIWNAIQKLLRSTISYIETTIVCDFFKDPIEVRIGYWSNTDRDEKERIEKIQQKYNKLQWYEVYDFIEFIVDVDVLHKRSINYDHIESLKEFKGSINNYLEREMSAYRLIDNCIVRITNENEISSIEKSLSIKDKKFEKLNSISHSDAFSNKQTIEYVEKSLLELEKINEKIKKINEP